MACRIVKARSLPDAVRLARQQPARVVPLQVAQQRYWMKQLREKRLILRLQKGSARYLMGIEQNLLAEFHARDAPVPEIVLKGPGYFVTKDGGMTLAQLLRERTVPPAERVRAVRAAASALARLHARGLCHGRPYLRDICWDGERPTFIDLERGASLCSSRRQMARDLVIFVFSFYTIDLQDTPEVSAACEAYRSADPGGIWQAATSWCRRWQSIEVALRPVAARERRRHPNKPYKEYQALRPFLNRFLTPAPPVTGPPRNTGMRDSTSRGQARIHGPDL